MRKNLSDFKATLSRKEMRTVNGGLFGICIEGVLDGIKGNTKVKIGKCH